MKMGQEGVPTVEEYLQANTKEGMTIGFDGRVVNEMLGETLEKTLPERFLQNRYGFLILNIPASPLMTVLQKSAKR